jgi:predicted deacylase
MSILPLTIGARGVGLTDGDLGQIIDTFRHTERGLLDLRLGATRLRLCRPDAQAPAASGPVTSVPAPFVGVFTASVRIGQTVGAGMRLGRVRSVQGEVVVTAPHDGTILAQCVAQGQFAGFGDPLFEILMQTPDRGHTE